MDFVCFNRFRANYSLYFTSFLYQGPVSLCIFLDFKPLNVNSVCDWPES